MSSPKPAVSPKPRSARRLFRVIAVGLWLAPFGGGQLPGLRGFRPLAQARGAEPGAQGSAASTEIDCPDLLVLMDEERSRNDDLHGVKYLFGLDKYRLWFRARAHGFRNFVHVPRGHSADLTSPFTVAFDESATAMFYRTERSPDPHAASHQRRVGIDTPLTFERRYGFHTLSMLMLRSDWEGKSLAKAGLLFHPSTPEELDWREFEHSSPASHAIRTNHDAFALLYRSYGRQGAGRSDQLRIFAEEDRAASLRTTHFVILVDDVVVAHLQAQYSDDPRDLLNLETHFGPIPRAVGERVFEIGRLFVLDAPDLPNDVVRTGLIGFGGRDYVRTLLYQRVFSWLAADAQASRVIMQMNGRGRDHFLASGGRGFGQWQFDSPGTCVLAEPGREEWVLTMNRANLLATEEEEMLSRLRQEKALTRRSRFVAWNTPVPAADTLSIFYRENEFAVLDRLRATLRLPGVLQTIEFPTAPDFSTDRFGVRLFNPPTRFVYYEAGE